MIKYTIPAGTLVSAYRTWPTNYGDWMYTKKSVTYTKEDMVSEHSPSTFSYVFKFPHASDGYLCIRVGRSAIVIDHD